MQTDLRDLDYEVLDLVRENPGVTAKELWAFWDEVDDRKPSASELAGAMDHLLRSNMMMAVSIHHPNNNPQTFCRYFVTKPVVAEKIMPERSPEIFVMGGGAFWGFIVTAWLLIFAFVSFIMVIYTK